jgi:hypothetical protein
MEPHSVNGTPANGGQVPGRDISGRKLAKALKVGTFTPDGRARLALRLQDGSAFLHHLTAKQARQLTGAKVCDVAAARRAERPVNGNGKHARVFYRHDLLDGDIDTIVAKIGPDKVMAALDRLTKPRCAATTEMFGASVAR